MATIRSRHAVLAAVVAITLAACSGSAATPAPSGALPTSVAVIPSAATASAAAPSVAAGAAIDPCTLVTQSEATALLGTDPGPAVETGTSDAPACAYGASLVVSVDTADGKAMFQTRTSSMTGAGGVTLTGVGDSAAATIVANTVADLEILKGGTLVSIMVQGNPSLQNITPAALTTLGRQAIARV